MTQHVSERVRKAVDVLRNGGLVGLPTETVYGLGADARNPAAVARIFAAKQRPVDHPLIVHVGHAEQLRDWARDVPEDVWLEGPGKAARLARGYVLVSRRWQRGHDGHHGLDQPKVRHRFAWVGGKWLAAKPCVEHAPTNTFPLLHHAAERFAACVVLT
jgi:hypothetical protein